MCVLGGGGGDCMGSGRYIGTARVQESRLCPAAPDEVVKFDAIYNQESVTALTGIMPGCS